MSYEDDANDLLDIPGAAKALELVLRAWSGNLEPFYLDFFGRTCEHNRLTERFELRQQVRDVIGNQPVGELESVNSGFPVLHVQFESPDHPNGSVP